MSSRLRSHGTTTSLRPPSLCELPSSLASASACLRPWLRQVGTRRRSGDSREEGSTLSELRRDYARASLSRFCEQILETTISFSFSLMQAAQRYCVPNTFDLRAKKTFPLFQSPAFEKAYSPLGSGDLQMQQGKQINIVRFRLVKSFWTSIRLRSPSFDVTTPAQDRKIFEILDPKENK